MTNLISLSLYSFNSFVFKTFITVCFFSVFFTGYRRASATSRSFRSAFFYFPLFIFIVFLFSFLFCFLLLPCALSIPPLISLFVPPFTFRSFFLQLLEQLFLCKVLHEYKSQIKENVANIISYFYCPTIISDFSFHLFLFVSTFSFYDSISLIVFLSHFNACLTKLSLQTFVT